MRTRSILVAAVASAMAVLTLSAPASASPTTIGPLTFTGARQPMVTSEYGGARADLITTKKHEHRLMLTRFADGAVTHTRLLTRGPIRGIQIDDGGRISVLGGVMSWKQHRCTLSVASWDAGDARASWTRIGTIDFCFGTGDDVPIPFEIDDAGDLAVITSTTYPDRIVIEKPGGAAAWQPLFTIPGSGARGQLQALHLGPDGDLVAVWGLESDGQPVSTSIRLTRMELGETSWTSSQLVGSIDDAAMPHELTLAPTGEIAFSADGSGGIWLGDVQGLDASFAVVPDTRLDVPHQSWGVDLLTVAQPGVVRAVLRHDGSLAAESRRYVGAEFAAGQVTAQTFESYGAELAFAPRSDANSAGDIVAVQGPRLSSSGDFNYFVWRADTPVGATLHEHDFDLGTSGVVGDPTLLASGDVWWQGFRSSTACAVTSTLDLLDAAA